MYKSIKLAMVMAIVIAISGYIVAVSDENDAIGASDLEQFLNSDQTAYVMSGNISFDDAIVIDKPIQIDGTLDLTIGTYTYNGSGPMFNVGNGNVLKIGGTIKTLNVNIDGGELQIDAAISLQGSATSGTISLIKSTATITVDDRFSMSSSTDIESSGTINLLDKEYGNVSCTGNGKVVSYESNENGYTLKKLHMSSDPNTSFFTITNKMSGKPITTIGSGAFDGCTPLETVNFRNANNTILESGAFSGNHGIKTVNATRVTSIGNDVFSGCSTITTLDLSALTHITAGMFTCKLHYR